MTRTLLALLLAAVLGGTLAWFERPDLVAAAAQPLPHGLRQQGEARLPKQDAPADGQPKQAAAGQQGAGQPRRNAVAVALAPAESRDFVISRRSIGTIEPVASVTVRSRIDSQLVEQHVTDGQMVKAGDMLFTLDDRELAATVAQNEATLARDEAVQERTEADLKRKRDLLSTNAGSQQQVDQAVSDAKSAAAAVAGTKASLELNRVKLGYTKIRAPIDGRIGTVMVTPGNLVRAGDTGTGLVTITQVKPVRVSFTLPERELAALREAMAAGKPPLVHVRPNGQDKAVASAPVSFIDSAVDTQSGTITVRAEFPNDGLELWPGQYVDVQVDLRTRPDTVTVPTVAVQTGQDSPYVLVAQPHGPA
ncbi:efflux RND transporter periplasmic adaptor subunit, partial [Nostoc sp. NIES-2111]